MRQQGFYWVVYKGQQQVALYLAKPECWWLPGKATSLKSSALEQISDTPLEPEIEVGHG